MLIEQIPYCGNDLSTHVGVRDCTLPVSLRCGVVGNSSKPLTACEARRETLSFGAHTFHPLCRLLVHKDLQGFPASEKNAHLNGKNGEQKGNMNDPSCQPRTIRQKQIKTGRDSGYRYDSLVSEGNCHKKRALDPRLDRGLCAFKAIYSPII